MGHSLSVARRAVLTFLGLGTIAAAVLYLLYRAQAEVAWTTARTDEEQVIELSAEAIAADLSRVVGDVLYLSESVPLRHWLARPDAATRAEIADEFLAFSRRRGIYDQVRLLDERGMEVVRVDWNSGLPAVVRDEELQDKSDRPYVTEIAKLKRGDVYQSPFDLNIERGKIEEPIKPMIRFGTPIFDERGNRRGMVVLNYLGQRLLIRLNSISRNRLGELSLLNAEGYWLFGPHADDQWAFMYPDRSSRSFGNAFPQAWERMLRENSSAQFETASGRFTYRRISSNQDRAAVFGSQPWVLVTHISPERWAGLTADLRRDMAIAAIALAMLLALASWVISRHRVARELSEAAVRDLNARLERDNAELQALNKELEAFSYSVSHDLRAPLRAIDGFSRSLLEDQNERLNDHGKADLMRVRNAAQRMGTLIDDLLKLARVARSEIVIGPVDLSGMATEIAAELTESAPDREAEFAIEPSLWADGDPRLLRVALANLLGNAWKFTSKREHARIEFGRTKANGSSAYYVRDNGAGFEMQYADKLFGAFQRLHDAREFPGTGIGLATVQRVIRKHGGAVWAESAKDQGATFYFTL